MPASLPPPAAAAWAGLPGIGLTQRRHPGGERGAPGGALAAHLGGGDRRVGRAQVVAGNARAADAQETRRVMTGHVLYPTEMMLAWTRSSTSSEVTPVTITPS